MGGGGFRHWLVRKYHLVYSEQVETARKTGVLVFSNRGLSDIPEQVSFVEHSSQSPDYWGRGGLRINFQEYLIKYHIIMGLAFNQIRLQGF